MSQEQPYKAKQIVLIGDVHGNLKQLQRLWDAIERKLGKENFDLSDVVFLGDYCDRGEHTKETLDYLIQLQKTRPRTHFIAGNHDMAMGAFLGVYPEPKSGFKETWVNDNRKDKEGWWSSRDPAEEARVHLQGRRWAATADLFAARSTFASYGVAFQDRTALLLAVPDNHKAFIRDLPWIVELEGLWGEQVVCVHAGLVEHEDYHTQVALLRNRDVSVVRPPQLFGRTEVLPFPPNFPDSCVLASGHHGFLELQPRRLVIDNTGGDPLRPIAAVVLPAGDTITSDS
eukprot:c9118_g1_i2.p1 GENE.c9118_g1_i2~~c9118_g1_i2.p1  ORF type:complete len:286 (-),score=65.69 c9118_g1_i2:205-1062(-)